EHGAELGLLPVGRVDQRKPWDPDVVTGDRQRRLDRDRVRIDRKRVDHRPELGLDLTRALEVALLEAGQQIAYSLPNEVREDEDAALPSHLEEREQEVVVPGVERKAAFIHDPLRLVDVGRRLL